MSSGACFTRWVMATRSGLVDHSVAAGAQGISDAFRDAEMCADALDDALSGRCDFDNAMGDYQSTRDEHVLPMYEFTAQLATLEPPPPDLQRILVARKPGGYGRICARQLRRHVAGGVLSQRRTSCGSLTQRDP
jgi:hypothetical protein